MCVQRHPNGRKMARRRGRNREPAEVNPIFLRKDWAGNTMEEYKTDGMWGWRSMVANAAASRGGAGETGRPGSGAQVRVMSFK